MAPLKSGRASAVCGVFAASLCVSLAGQQPQFRRTAEVIVVDAQVIRRDGTPISGITADQFEVFVDGKKRPVVDVQFTGAAQATAASRDALAARPSSAAPAGEDRLIMIAVDQASFPPSGQYAAREAATRLVERAGPLDLVGLMAFPGGLNIQPSRSREAITQAIGRIQGTRVEVVARSYNISATEASHLRSRSSETTAIIDRECRLDRYNPACPQAVVQEGRAIADNLEQQALISINGLHDTMDALQSVPGRKTLVVVSAGLPMSNLPGGRPNLDAETKRIARRAAATNLNLYVFYMNIHFLQAFSAASRLRNHTIFDDVTMFGLGLEKFADTAGGLFSQVEVDPNPFVDRVYRETSAAYLISVETAPSDHDGREHGIRVTVKAPGATLRYRRVVIIPPRR